MPFGGLPASSTTEKADHMRQLLTAAAATAGFAVLWMAALSELARQPVTHTGTQPTTHHVNR